MSPCRFGASECDLGAVSDVLFIIGLLAFFAVAWVFVKACEHIVGEE